MAEHVDKEIEAIKAVLTALEPLPPEVRTSVLRYVTRRLQIASEPAERIELPTSSGLGAGSEASERKAAEQQLPIHIKDFKEQKKPRYAIEMAALVAYYLENLAPPNDRKDRITTRDIDTYFKIAEFELPKKSQFTLPNAKAAGYLDAVGNGEYKLNAVGHNLVVHSMPRGKDDKLPSRKKAKKKPASSASKRK